MPARETDLTGALGQAPEELPLGMQFRLAGLWAAFEIYTPANLALRKIAAIGPSAESCIEQLQAQSIDPAKYEYTVLTKPY